MNINVEMKAVFKNTQSSLKAIATVKLYDCFIIRNVKVIEHDGHTFVSYPTYRTRDGNWRSLCHPSNAVFSKELQQAVLEAYAQN